MQRTVYVIMKWCKRTLRSFRTPILHLRLWLCPLLSWVIRFRIYNVFEPAHDKTYKIACAPSEDSDQPGHPPSLIRVFAVPMKKDWVFSYPLSAQQRLWSDWADAQAELSLRWAHMPFCWFCHALAHLLSQQLAAIKRLLVLHYSVV